MAGESSTSRRGYLRTLSTSIGAVLTASTVASASDPDTDAVTCPSGCGGGGSYPFVMNEIDDVVKTYNGHDYRGTVGLQGRYYGSYTNENWEDSGWLHDFVISGFSAARSRGQYADSWNLDPAIYSQTAKIQNNKPDKGAIVSTVGTQNEWVGESRRASDTGNPDQYMDAMKIAVETLISEVSQKAGYALNAAQFVDALTNDKGTSPDQTDQWTPSWNYGEWLGSATDCSNTIRFAITSPKLGDYIDVTTTQEANVPTVNDSYSVPHSTLDWYMETSNDDGGLSSASVTESRPSTTVNKDNLPPYEEVQKMADRGEVKRVMLPIQVEASTSDL